MTRDVLSKNQKTIVTQVAQGLAQDPVEPVFTSTATSALIRRLEARGIVYLRPSYDLQGRQAWQVLLTDRGDALAQTLA